MYNSFLLMMNGGHVMYRYIECNRAESEEHFRKFRHLDEMKNYIEGLNEAGWHEDALKTGIDEDYLNHSSMNQTSPDVHVYRIKDLCDAINTSVILDVNQKEDYHNLLSDKQGEFDADVDFLELCDNVGECDIY